MARIEAIPRRTHIICLKCHHIWVARSKYPSFCSSCGETSQLERIDEVNLDELPAELQLDVVVLRTKEAAREARDKAKNKDRKRYMRW